MTEYWRPFSPYYAPVPSSSVMSVVVLHTDTPIIEIYSIRIADLRMAMYRNHPKQESTLADSSRQHACNSYTNPDRRMLWAMFSVPIHP